MKLAGNNPPIYSLCYGINALTTYWDLASFPFNVPYEFSGYSQNITMICVQDVAQGIPPGMQEQTVYYLKKFTNPVRYKVYNKLSDSLYDVNPIAPSFSKTFQVNFIVRSEGFFECADFGNDDPLDSLVCCPKNEYFKDIYDTVKMTVSGGGELVMKRTGFNSLNVGIPYAPFGMQVIDLWGFISGPSIPYGETNLASWFKGVFTFGTTLNSIHNLDLTVTITTGNFAAMTANYQAIVTEDLSFQMTRTTGAPFFQNFFSQYFETLLPQVISVSLDQNSKSVLPASIRLYMPDAYFYDPDRPVTIGNIDETLILDQESGYYISEKKNYYNIPGRLHIRPKFWPLANSGIRFMGNTLYTLKPYVYENQTDYQSLNMQGTFYQEKTNPFWSGGLKLFFAFDEYSGYQTGLPRGTLWLDSRIDINQQGISYSDSSLFVVGYSKVTPGMGYSQDTIMHSSFYKTGYFSLRSKHPSCYLTSLNV